LFTAFCVTRWPAAPENILNKLFNWIYLLPTNLAAQQTFV